MLVGDTEWQYNQRVKALWKLVFRDSETGERGDGGQNGIFKIEILEGTILCHGKL